MAKKVAIALRSLSGESHCFVTACTDAECSNRFSPNHFATENPQRLPPLIAERKLFDENKDEIVIFNSQCETKFNEGLENYCFYALGVRGMGVNVKNSVLMEATFDDSDQRALRENEAFSDRISSGQV